MTELFQRSFLAGVLDDAGKTGDAIRVLEQDVRPAMASFVSGWPWPQINEHLLRLYRKAGRFADAERLEHEMRRYLAAADPDHPVAARLAAPEKSAVKH